MLKLALMQLGMILSITGCEGLARDAGPDGAIDATQPRLEQTAEADAPTVETKGDTMLVTSPDGRSTISITQDDADEAETEVRRENGVTILERRSATGSITVIQGGGHSTLEVQTRP